MLYETIVKVLKATVNEIIKTQSFLFILYFPTQLISRQLISNATTTTKYSGLFCVTNRSCRFCYRKTDEQYFKLKIGINVFRKCEGLNW